METSQFCDLAKASFYHISVKSAHYHISIESVLAKLVQLFSLPCLFGLHFFSIKEFVLSFLLECGGLTCVVIFFENGNDYISIFPSTLQCSGSISNSKHEP